MARISLVNLSAHRRALREATDWEKTGNQSGCHIRKLRFLVALANRGSLSRFHVSGVNTLLTVRVMLNTNRRKWTIWIRVLIAAIQGQESWANAWKPMYDISRAARVVVGLTRSNGAGVAFKEVPK